MKTITSKEFAYLAQQATSEVKGTFASPFVIINQLNKATKGDFTKVEGCGITCDNLKKVAKQVKTLHNFRYPFDISVLPKTADKKVIGWWTPISAQQSELSSIMCGEVVMCADPRFQGRELTIREGVVGVFRPIPLTIMAIFRTFCKVARCEIQEGEKQAKAAQKQAEKVAKAKVAVEAVFGELVHTFSNAEILEKYARIKAAK